MVIYGNTPRALNTRQELSRQYIEPAQSFLVSYEEKLNTSKSSDSSHGNSAQALREKLVKAKTSLNTKPNGLITTTPKKVRNIPDFFW